MKKISFRTLLRQPMTVFPIPQEGIHVVRRDGDDFMLCPYPVPTRGKDQEVKSRKPACEIEYLIHGAQCTMLAHKAFTLPANWQHFGKDAPLLCEKHYNEAVRIINR